MNTTLKTILLTTLVVILAGALFFGGMAFSHYQLWSSNGYGWMMNSYDQGRNAWFDPFGMMGRFAGNNMMGYGGFHSGMMGNNAYRGGGAYQNGMMGNGAYRGGMMDGNWAGNAGMMGGAYEGMMPGFGYTDQTNIEPLTTEEAKTAVIAYLERYGYADFSIKEIMTFSNNAYAIIEEPNTGIGAFELLVDPSSKVAYPEVGPNMMWNEKYGMMGANGMMGGGMMGGNYNRDTASASMNVSAEKALELAQAYLDKYLPGVEVSEEITQFYGYYTIDVEQDGTTSGMLSVNGYDGSVMYHNWHGTFVDMVEF